MYSKITVLALLVSLMGVSLVAAQPPVEYTTAVTQATKKLVGINCIADTIYNLEDAAGDFLYNVDKCGSKAKETVFDLVDDVNTLEFETNKTINYNDNACGNAAYKEDTDGKKDASSTCIAYMTRQMTRLYNAADSTLNDVNELLDGTTLNACLTMATTSFKLSLENFPKFIEVCGKLVN